MKWKELAGPWEKKLRSALGKYKYVLLVMLVGVVFLTLPVLGSEESATKTTAAGGETTTFNLEEMEGKMADALSKIDGAGKVTVVLTVKTGARQVLAEDGESSQKGEDTEQSTNTVVVSKGSGYQEVVAVQEIFPKFQGALVVCDGGGNPAVKLKLVEAVAALTGLGSDKISICKGK
jgi:stage III sporulation protein AG